jgi:hypothetical protein
MIKAFLKLGPGTSLGPTARRGMGRISLLPGGYKELRLAVLGKPLMSRHWL